MRKLEGKVAVVTGSAKGIGASIARHLAAEGARVVINYAKSKGPALEVVNAIREAGGEAIESQADVRNLADIQRMFSEVKGKFGRIDILVNNAGIFEQTTLSETTAESFHRMFDTNVLGTIQVTREGVKLMNDGGSILNISSIAAKSPSTNNSVYAATKGAIDTLTMAYAKELGARKIRVNAVNPSSIETEGFIASGAKGSPWQAEGLKNTPLGRMGLPEDVAKVAAFLVSDDAGWISGETILVSGGRR